MSKRIVVDPVTRIEGHLRIDVEVDGGKVTKAWSSGQMWRGIENILQGRDPREAWLFTQRFCGVCTTVHAIASVRAVENAVGVEVPLNAQLIRNLILAAHAMHDHIVHFFHLSALDWVDVVSALDADPTATAKLAQSLSPWPRNSVQELTAVKDKLAGFVARGQLGPFANGYWGHAAMKLPPEVNLLAVSHYLQALDYQRTANKVVAILGGKTPNIQNLAVGGVANAINLDNQSTINMNTLFQIKNLLDEMHDFIKHVYLTDVCAIGRDVSRLAGLRRGRDQLPGRAGSAAGCRGHQVRSARRHDHERRPGHLQADHQLRGQVLRRQRGRGHRALLVRRATGNVIPTKRTRSRTTPTSRRTASTPGSSRRASRAK